MLTSRVIPCLDVRDGRVVKGVKFQGLRDVGDPAELAYLDAGDFFGEMAVFEKEVRSATVRAHGEARVLKIDKRTLLRRIREDPLLAVNLLKTMSHRIRELNSEVAHHRETRL